MDELSSRRATESQTILLVEDEAAVRNLVDLLLRGAGYRVLKAASPREAVKLVEGYDPTAIDLLLTDVLLPGMRGHHLAEQMRTKFPTVKVLYISGSIREELPPGSLLLEKPFRREQLLARVREALGLPALGKDGGQRH